MVIRDYLMTTDYCHRHGSMMNSKQVLPGDLADQWPQLTLISFLLHTIATQNRPFVHKISITIWRNKINITDSYQFARSPQRQLWTKYPWMFFSSLFFEHLQSCCLAITKKDQSNDQHCKVSTWTSPSPTVHTFPTRHSMLWDVRCEAIARNIRWLCFLGRKPQEGKLPPLGAELSCLGTTRTAMRICGREGER